MSKPPNIIFVMPDQQRWDSLGCYGNRFTETPNVDRLAASGVRFEQAFTTWPVCTPARGTMWSGVYTHAHNLLANVYKIDDAFESISLVKTTLFHLLKEAGYHTAHFGKWHLGEKQPAFFDTWRESFNSRFHHWVDGKKEGLYRPDLQTDACIDFIRRWADGGGGPFAMVQGYYPPHDPFTAPERFYQPYRDRGVPFAGYYAAVSNIDWNLGRILDALDETGLREQTMVIYFSDHGETFKGREDGEHKFVCYEEAIHIPFIVSWPGSIAPHQSRAEPVGLQDLLPTAVDYAGLPIPAHAQGASLRPLLEGASPPWRDHFYVQNITWQKKIEQRCYRLNDWKLIAAEQGPHFLFHTAEDPEEEFNLFALPSDEMPHRMQSLPEEARGQAESMAVALRAAANGLADGKGAALAEAVLKQV